MMPRYRSISLAALLLMLPTPAVAHPDQGETGGLVAGLLHPLTGADHLLVMLMVGLWAGLAFPHRAWVCPTAFIATMLAGFVWGATGGGFLHAEALILVSLLGMAAAIFLRARPPLVLGAGMVALFAVAHGFAHGAEMPADGDPLRFAGGFVIATAALHLLGIGIARVVIARRARFPERSLGVILSNDVAGGAGAGGDRR